MGGMANVVLYPIGDISHVNTSRVKRDNESNYLEQY